MDPSNNELSIILNKKTYQELLIDQKTGEIFVSEPWNGHLLYLVGHRTKVDDLSRNLAKQMELLYMNPQISDKEKYGRLEKIREAANSLKFVESDEFESICLQIERIEAFYQSRISQHEKLTEACKNGDLEFVKDLLIYNAGLGVNFPDPNGTTPLILAAKYGNLEIIRELLKHGANINATDIKGDTSLSLAAKNGHLDIIRELLKHGANINATDINGDTSVSLAAKNGEVQAFYNLIKMGADPDVKHRDGKTAWICAGEQGPNFLKAVVSEAKSRYDLDFLDTKNKDGETPLLSMLKCGNTVAVNALIEAGADTNEQNKEGQTVWSYAAKHGLIELLKDAGADINAKYHGYGDTALWIALQNGDTNTCMLLMKAGADINTRNTSGKTILNFALKNNLDDFVETLLKAGVDINNKDWDGETGLIAAVRYGKSVFVKAMIETGAKINEINYNGFSALKMAEAKGHEEIKQLLIPTKPDDEIIARDKEIFKAKSLAHSAQVAGDHQLEGIAKDFGTIRLESMDTRTYWCGKMSKATELLSSSHGDIFPIKESRALQELFKSATIPDPQSVVDQIRSGAPTILPIGYRTHAVAILFYGNHFILCDRESKKPVEIFKYNKDFLDKEIVSKLFKTREFGNFKDYEKLLFEELPKKLDFREQEFFEKEIESNCNLEKQRVGNCTWASLETAVWAFLIFEQLFTKKDEQNPLNLDDIRSTVQIHSEKFNVWLAFNQLYNMEHYLGERKLRSADDSEKVKKSADLRNMFILNNDLVRSALKNIDTQARKLGEKNRAVILPYINTIKNDSIEHMIPAHIKKASLKKLLAGDLQTERKALLECMMKSPEILFDDLPPVGTFQIGYDSITEETFKGLSKIDMLNSIKEAIISYAKKWGQNNINDVVLNEILFCSKERFASDIMTQPSPNDLLGEQWNVASPKRNHVSFSFIKKELMEVNFHQEVEYIDPNGNKRTLNIGVKTKFNLSNGDITYEPHTQINKSEGIEGQEI